ncbi:ABC transporter permease [Nocardioides daeguensis]|uniref:Multidrug efflux ABC transporter permease n=1 Tax=Nocardioides daeguensis TaxID=908359 RepID=A0ABP6W0V3_9ACTN|nr:ABC transporter permease [Nocardioides daeguensis]MBV6726693.1 ABC transporter permease [Nocardioides daeguensis]MCR1774555.1 ABC transporter permease [Nocardioides daeguensis]
MTGWRLLLRLGLRQDRVLAPVALAVLVLMSIASAAATPGLYADQADRVRAAEAINASPAIVALYGPILDVTSEGELAMTKMTVLYAVFVAVLFIVVVRRHTRVEEETGRTELVGGTAVGRHAPLFATLLEAVLLALVLGVLTALGNTVSGLDGAGSLAFGALWAGTALVAAGIAAVTAQLSASARTCAAYAAGTVGVLFVLRAAGDTGPAWLSWVSPLGWNTQVRAYGDVRWWLLPCYLLVSGALVALAFALRSRRDLGSGLVPTRPGPRTGSPRLADAFALAIKVHTVTLLLWSVAAGVLGVVFGMIAPGIGDLLDAEVAQSIIDELGGALVAAILSVVAVVLTYFAVTVVNHAGHDEEDGRAELVLATATSRSRWFAASAVLALVGTAWLLVVTGAGLWIGYVAADGPGIGNLLLAALAWAPASWVVGALAVLSLSAGLRWSPLVWAWPAAFLTLSLLGDLLELPGWLTGLSPYSHVPSLPADAWSWGSAGGLSAVAAALLTVAWWRFRERDIG